MFRFSITTDQATSLFVQKEPYSLHTKTHISTTSTTGTIADADIGQVVVLKKGEPSVTLSLLMRVH